MANFENAEHFVKLLIGVTSVAATGGADLASALTIVETLRHASKLDMAIREMGLHDVAKRLAKTAKEVETRLSANADFAGTGLADATALFRQAVKYCTPAPDQVVANNLSGGLIADWMLAQIAASPVGRDFRNAPLAARYLREVVTPTLDALVEDGDFRAKMLEPGLWRRVLEQMDRVEGKIDRQTESLERIEQALARIGASLPLAVAKSVLEDFGFAQLPDDPLEIERILRSTAERYKLMQTRLQELQKSGGHVLQGLLADAGRLVESGQFDEADQILVKAENHGDVVRAGIRSNRADLAQMRLRYKEAADHYRAAAEILPESEVQGRWCYHLRCAAAFFKLGNEFNDNSALMKAVEIYRVVALPLATRHQTPQNWATTQDDLGSALQSLGERTGNAALLEEAVIAFRLALLVRLHATVPVEWAKTQHNLGNSLKILGKWKADSNLLGESIAIFRAVLLELNRAQLPQEWAKAKNSLGAALRIAGERERNNELLKEAVGIFREALEERMRSTVPLDWAETQNNLANALESLGEREDSIALLEEAISAFREALQVYTRDRIPPRWAGIQNNLGNALCALGERGASTEHLLEAVNAYRAALQEYTRDRMPPLWAMAQNNLGSALRELGSLQGNAALLELSVTAIRNALQVRTRAEVPAAWAGTQNNLANTFLAYFNLVGDSAHLVQAKSANDMALEVLHTADAPDYLAKAEATRQAILAATPTPDPSP